METEKGGGARDKQSTDKTHSIPPSSTQENAAASSKGEKESTSSTTQKIQQSQESQIQVAALQQDTGTEESSSQQQSVPSTPTQRHQVIAVSASKGPAAFFNLTRKFLVTDEYCDLSALEGAIVSAVDAAHLLERSKLADIVRIQTAFVPVEPKRRPQQVASHDSEQQDASLVATGKTSNLHSNVHREDQPFTKKQHQSKKGLPLRRSRIIITVKRTEDYKRWLEENPHHSAGSAEDIHETSSS